MSMDDWGRTYVCGNSDPFHLVMYDSRYLARNPYLQAPPAAVNIAPAGKYHEAATASAPSSRGGRCGRGCGARGSSRAPTRGARRRASSPAAPA